MKTLYLIREMKLDGATFNIYNKVHLSDEAKFTYKDGNLYMVSDKGQYFETCRYYKISDKPKGYDMEANSYLPYFAKVTEDLPGSCKGLEPAIYDNCHLTTDFPNGYLIFEHLKTGKRLKIAMNSHTYESIN